RPQLLGAPRRRHQAPGQTRDVAPVERVRRSRVVLGVVRPSDEWPGGRVRVVHVPRVCRCPPPCYPAVTIRTPPSDVPVECVLGQADQGPQRTDVTRGSTGGSPGSDDVRRADPGLVALLVGELLLRLPLGLDPAEVVVDLGIAAG